MHNHHHTSRHWVQIAHHHEFNVSDAHKSSPDETKNPFSIWCVWCIWAHFESLLRSWLMLWCVCWNRSYTWCECGLQWQRHQSDRVRIVKTWFVESWVLVWGFRFSSVETCRREPDETSQPCYWKRRNSFLKPWPVIEVKITQTVFLYIYCSHSLSRSIGMN